MEDVLIISFAVTFVIFYLSAVWQVFEKAGEPGWASLIPIYNWYILLRIAGKPDWWTFLFLVPFVSVVIRIITCIEVAKNFGRGAGFGLGLALLQPIFYPILAFGDSEYVGAKETDTRKVVNENGEIIEEIPLDEW